jgi:hypothetical protein
MDTFRFTFTDNGESVDVSIEHLPRGRVLAFLQTADGRIERTGMPYNAVPQVAQAWRDAGCPKLVH